MKVSVFNICSDALDMLKFSTEIAMLNAGNEFHYVLILWNPSKEVLNWIEKENGINRIIDRIEFQNNIGFNYFFYETDNSLSFIENLRNCFNLGFDKGFEFNDYTCGINTDMAFYKNWLKNLAKYANEDAIINCRQLEPNPTIHHESPFNFGETVKEKFNFADFYTVCDSKYEDKLIREEEWRNIMRRSVWRNIMRRSFVRADATPHLIHKNLWQNVGKWNVIENPADVMWFDRAKQVGFRNMKSLGSIVYHAGGIETKRKLKVGSDLNA